MNSLVNGGTERIVSELVRYTGLELILLESDDDLRINDSVRYFKLSKINKKSLPIFRWTISVISAFKLSKLMVGVDSVIVYLERSLFATVVALKLSGSKVKVIYSVESDVDYKYLSKSKIYFKILTFLYSFVHVFVFKTTKQKDDFFRHFKNLNGKESFVLGNPLFIDNERCYKCQYLVSKSSKKNILSLARLHKTKNIPASISIFKQLLIKNSGYRLVVAGDGEEKIKLINYALSLGLRVKELQFLDLDTELVNDIDVVFLGHVENTSSLFEKCDLLISTSESESFGLTVIEAVAHGKRVVTSNFGGVLSDLKIDSISVIDDKLSCFNPKYNFDTWVKEIERQSSFPALEDDIEYIVDNYEKSKYFNRLLSLI